LGLAHTFFFQKFERGVGVALEFRELLFIVLLRVGLIEDVVLLVPQVPAAEAVGAPAAVVGEMHVVAVQAAIEEGAVVYAVAVHAFIREFGVVEETAVHEIFGILHKLRVVAVLVCFARDIQVASLIVAAVAYILGVVAVYDIKRERGYLQIHFFELLKERTIEIELTPVLEGVEFIAPPALGAPDHLGFFLRVVGDDGLFAGVTRAFVKRALVPHREPPRVPAVGAEGRGRDAHAGVEGGVVGGDFELPTTFFAGFTHR
jgi:hypothetical protein